MLIGALIIAGLILLSKSYEDRKAVSIDYYTSKEKFVRSATSFIRSKIESGESDQDIILTNMNSDRPDIRQELEGFNLHFEIASDQVILFVCDKDNLLRYKDSSEDEIKIENKFYTEKAPCPFKKGKE